MATANLAQIKIAKILLNMIAMWQSLVLRVIWAILVWNREENIHIMPGNQLFKRFFNSLICKLFIIGHATEGESIVFLLCDGETVVYSCVVDSFTCEKEVVSEVILKKWKTCRYYEIQ